MLLPKHSKVDLQLINPTFCSERINYIIFGGFAPALLFCCKVHTFFISDSDFSHSLFLVTWIRFIKCLSYHDSLWKYDCWESFLNDSVQEISLINCLGCAFVWKQMKKWTKWGSFTSYFYTRTNSIKTKITNKKNQTRNKVKGYECKSQIIDQSFLNGMWFIRSSFLLNCHKLLPFILSVCCKETSWRHHRRSSSMGKFKGLPVGAELTLLLKENGAVRLCLRGQCLLCSPIAL